MAGKDEVFKKPRLIVGWLRTGLALKLACVVVLFCSIVVEKIDVAGLNPLYYTTLDVPPAFAVYTAAFDGCFVLSLLCFALLMVFIYRINRNTHLLPAPGMRFTPGWAAGWFFIPVAWWWKPYQVVSELFRANTDPDGWQALRTPWLVKIWWALQVLAGIGGLIVHAMIRAGMFADDEANMLRAALYALLAVRIILLYGLVVRLGQLQRDAYAKRGPDAVF